MIALQYERRRTSTPKTFDLTLFLANFGKISTATLFRVATVQSMAVRQVERVVCRYLSYLYLKWIIDKRRKLRRILRVKNVCMDTKNKGNDSRTEAENLRK